MAKRKIEEIIFEEGAPGDPVNVTGLPTKAPATLADLPTPPELDVEKVKSQLQEILETKKFQGRPAKGAAVPFKRAAGIANLSEKTIKQQFSTVRAAIIKALKDANTDPAMIKQVEKELARIGPKRLLQMGASEYLLAIADRRPEPFLLRTARVLGFQNPTLQLPDEVRGVLAEVKEAKLIKSKTAQAVEGLAEKLPGKAGKAAKKAVSGITGDGKAILPKPAASTVKALEESGVRGFTKGSKLASKALSLGPVAGAAFAGLDAKYIYDSLVGDPAEAREIIARGRTASGEPVRSVDMVREIIRQQDALQRRKQVGSTLEPEMMQKIIGALAGESAPTGLTDTEVSIGSQPLGAPGVAQGAKPEQVQALLDRLLAEMGA